MTGEGQTVDIILCTGKFLPRSFPYSFLITTNPLPLSFNAPIYLLVWILNVLVNISRLYRGRVPRLSVCQFYVLSHTRQSGETMTFVSAGHIILTPIQPVGSRRPQRESNPGPPHQELRALPT